MIVKYFWLTCEFVAYTTKGKQPSTIKTPGIGTESARHVGRNASRFFGAAVCWNAFIRWYFVALNNHGFWQKRGFFLCCNGLRAMGGDGFHCFMRTHVPVSPLVHPLLTLTSISPIFPKKSLITSISIFLYRFHFSGNISVYLVFSRYFYSFSFLFNTFIAQ